MPVSPGAAGHLQAPGGIASGVLPPEVLAALRSAQVPPEALTVVVQEVGSGLPRLAWRQEQLVNPASLMKLVTTYAALDLLGPAYTWSTPLWLAGTVRQPGPRGVLEGDLVIKGTGDPKLVVERVWLLLKRVQQLGVREIRGNIVLDRTAFPDTGAAPANFDNEPLRPYNVRADALMLNQKSLMLRFMPDASRGVAAVSWEPTLAGVSIDGTVPLSSGACDDWRGGLGGDFSDPLQLRFRGSYPLSCGEKLWPLAYPDAAGYNARLLAGLWREMDGQLGGSVRDGVAPASPPTAEVLSPPLAEVIRDINKFSNNTMAQQLFLTLGLALRGQGTPEASRATVREWLQSRFGAAAGGAVVDNGSGLSRETRVTATLLAQVLLQAWASPVMPELASSLPLTGLDGTMKRSRAPQGRAHMKTGSLKDVAAIAGYVDTDSGRRQVLVAIINHPNANAARPALDALLQWTTLDRSRSP